MVQQTSVNIASHLPKMAELQPYHRAVVYPSGRDDAGRVTYAHLTYSQLDQESNKIASGLESIGIKRGTKTILMVKPSLEFFALTFALYKVGAVPVMVDPGMGLKRMLHCFKSTQPEAFIGISLAHAVRVLFPSAFRSVNAKVTVGRRWFWGGPTLKKLIAAGDPDYQMAPTDADEVAAILFTTGSTGPPKGVVYTHGRFDAQVQYLKDRFGIKPGEVDLPTFPLFALFGPALGMTAIVPDMDPTRPAHVDPTKIIEAIHNHGVTTMFGSPALLNRVGRYGKANGVKLPTLKRVLSAGAPVTHDNMETFHSMLSDDAQIFTPYGATEALPVAAIGSHELMRETRKDSESGKGICVGLPMEGHEIHIIEIKDEPIPTWSEDLCLPEGEIGEIIVRGTVVTREYYERPDATELAKIVIPSEEKEERFFHRMGDVGWRDDKGRLWFCGRKAHRVVTTERTLFTVPCEAIFNGHEDVYRSALVGVGDKGSQTPVIIVELEANKQNKASGATAQTLFSLAANSELTKDIKHLLFHPSFPVDIRHNAKIFREKLSVWATQQLAKAHRPKGASS